MVGFITDHRIFFYRFIRALSRVGARFCQYRCSISSAAFSLLVKGGKMVFLMACGWYLKDFAFGKGVGLSQKDKRNSGE